MFRLGKFSLCWSFCAWDFLCIGTGLASLLTSGFPCWNSVFSKRYWRQSIFRKARALLSYGKRRTLFCHENRTRAWGIFGFPAGPVTYTLSTPWQGFGPCSLSTPQHTHTHTGELKQGSLYCVDLSDSPCSHTRVSLTRAPRVPGVNRVTCGTYGCRSLAASSLPVRS